MDHPPQDPTHQDQDPKRTILLSRADVGAPRDKEAIIHPDTYEAA